MRTCELVIPRRSKSLGGDGIKDDRPVPSEVGIELGSLHVFLCDILDAVSAVHIVVEQRSIDGATVVAVRTEKDIEALLHYFLFQMRVESHVDT